MVDVLAVNLPLFVFNQPRYVSSQAWLCLRNVCQCNLSKRYTHTRFMVRCIAAFRSPCSVMSYELCTNRFSFGKKCHFFILHSANSGSIFSTTVAKGVTQVCNYLYYVFQHSLDSTGNYGKCSLAAQVFHLINCLNEECFLPSFTARPHQQCTHCVHTTLHGQYS